MKDGRRGKNEGWEEMRGEGRMKIWTTGKNKGWEEREE